MFTAFDCHCCNSRRRRKNDFIVINVDLRRSPRHDPPLRGAGIPEAITGRELSRYFEISEVQAAEIRLGNGVFWGVQYHP
jgi:hypothetical protein